MMIFEETITTTCKGKELINNVDDAMIIWDGNIYRNYCILSILEDKVLIKEGNQIKLVTDIPEDMNCIIQALLRVNDKPAKKTKKNNTKKTNKKED